MFFFYFTISVKPPAKILIVLFQNITIVPPKSPHNSEMASLYLALSFDELMVTLSLSRRGGREVRD